MSVDPASLAAAYFDSWKAKDFDTLRSLLSDDATFRGPLGTAANAEECIAGLRGLRQILTDVVIHKMLADQHDVMTWFDLHTSVAPPAPVVNWMHCVDGKVRAIRVTFDPRELIAANQS